jgi:hypothetical protein
MKANWRVFANVSNEKKAETAIKHFVETLGTTTNKTHIESYHKGGFLLRVETITKDESWSEVVLELLTLAERVGKGWQISGSIQNEFDIWTNESSVVGVQSIHLQCLRNQQA